MVVVTALYKFVTLDDYKEIREPLKAEMLTHGIKGTLLLAREGINGTISGTREGMDQILAYITSDARFSDIVYKESFHEKDPFKKTKVKIKKEIVTMGVDGIDPTKIVGTYVKPEEWNSLISDPETVLIDTRNDYEVEIGTFKNALNPDTKTFREFPKYVKENLDPQKHKKVAMFCTGGIRCEKSTAYLKEQGFEEVYHLEGGILKYLEDVPEKETMWEGECFVFDDRITVNHSLEKGTFDRCYGCGDPITDEDKLHEKYESEVTCPRCYDSKTEAQKERYRARKRQLERARERGEL